MKLSELSIQRPVLTPEEFSSLVVSNAGGVLVKLSDVGRVELGAEDERSALRFNSTPAVAIGVVRQSKANLIQVADAIRAELPKIQEALPPGVKLAVAFDQSIFVSRSIREAEDTLVLAAVLVVIIIFHFLRNLRATIIPGQGSSFVWVTDHGKATRRQVELGVRTPGFVELKSGVDSGEVVVVGGQERLGEGARVSPKLIQRSPANAGEANAGEANAGEESASVGAR
jgi:hypothetical protein